MARTSKTTTTPPAPAPAAKTGTKAPAKDTGKGYHGSSDTANKGTAKTAKTAKV